MRRAVSWALGAAVAALLALLALSAVGGSRAGSSLAAPGRPVPASGGAAAFSLARLSGPGRLSLASFAHRPLVIDFWASWCAACRSEAGALDAVVKRYRPLGVAFVGVDTEDQPSLGRQFVRVHHITFPSVQDPHMTLAARYGFSGLPDMVIVAADERVAYVVRGAIDPAAVDRALAELVGPAAHPR